jgi:hypothetical protein
VLPWGLLGTSATLSHKRSQIDASLPTRFRYLVAEVLPLRCRTRSVR